MPSHAVRGKKAHFCDRYHIASATAELACYLSIGNMETHHEGTYRCTRVGHADCCPHVRSVRERGPNVPREFLIRV